MIVNKKYWKKWKADIENPVANRKQKIDIKTIEPQYHH